MAFGTRTLSLLFSGLALSTAACMNAQTQSDWIPLFDGTNTNAWRAYQKPDFPTSWQIVDGALTMTGERGEDIVTKDQFENFELELDWMVHKGGNSGVFFHAREDSALKNVWLSAPEYQVLDNEAHKDGLDARTSAGSNYALHAPVRDVTKQPGEWNHARIVVNGSHVEHWLNGEKLLEYELWSDDWMQRVAGSKFKDMPVYGQARTGHIALQGDHGWVAYRNIRIRRL